MRFNFLEFLETFLLFASPSELAGASLSEKKTPALLLFLSFFIFFTLGSRKAGLNLATEKLAKTHFSSEMHI